MQTVRFSVGGCVSVRRNCLWIRLTVPCFMNRLGCEYENQWQDLSVIFNCTCKSWYPALDSPLALIRPTLHKRHLRKMLAVNSTDTGNDMFCRSVPVLLKSDETSSSLTAAVLFSNHNNLAALRKKSPQLSHCLFLWES